MALGIFLTWKSASGEFIDGGMALCTGNVLLSSSTDNRHKFCAKVADFGLARDLGVVSRVETRTYGTLTHMAPEVLSADMVSKVCSSPP